VAIATATLLPYLRASMAGELHRVLEPTAAVRAKGSLHILDALGLYLNNFAWTYEGTIAAWAVGIPVLVGLACVGRAALRRSLPVVVMGALALVLAVVPTIGPIGDAMASLGPLFPSRFPAADYKPAVAIALSLRATQGWSDVAGRSVRARRTAPVVAAAVVVGAVVAPSTHALPTRHLWVVVAVAVAAAAAASWRPGRQWALAGVVLVLVVVDGTREVTDYRHESGTVPWRITPAQADVDPARDQFVRRLPALLDAAPVRRPARVGPTAPFDLFPTGTNADASGWVADRYHLTDYGSTITRARYTAEHNPRWSRLLLAPWQAYAWSCRSVGCSFGRIRVPPAPAWRPSAAVRSVSYAAGRITYSVSLTQPALMVENELAVPGWRSDRPGVRIVDARIPLRAWRLPAGRYRFSASYRAPGRELQLAVLGLGLVAWLACPVALRRRAHRLVFGAD
jgi:hypothetical protein